MAISTYNEPISMHPLSMEQRRLLILLGILSITTFVYFDLQLITESLSAGYFVSRFVFQLPAAMIVVGMTYVPHFQKRMQTAIMLSLIVITYANYAFIIYAWKLESIVFPYEGTFLYSYFALFVLRLGFKRALLYCFVVLIGFIALIAQYPIYGSSSPINGSFVAITLIVGLFATYHLDSTQTKLTTLNQQLSLLSTQDPLTQLLNRRSYLQKFEQLLSYCQRTGSSVSVFMVDIDNFKHYNDHFGHLAGDDAIVKQAKILTRTFQRDTDILCRYGGEEFVVVVLDCTPQDCERMASSILQHWKMERLPHAPELDSAFLSCSIGVYSETPNSDSTPESFLKQADDALYLAKDQGKARYVRLATYATVS